VAGGDDVNSEVGASTGKVGVEADQARRGRKLSTWRREAGPADSAHLMDESLEPPPTSRTWVVDG